MLIQYRGPPPFSRLQVCFAEPALPLRREYNIIAAVLFVSLPYDNISPARPVPRATLTARLAAAQQASAGHRCAARRRWLCRARVDMAELLPRVRAARCLDSMRAGHMRAREIIAAAFA